MKKEPALWKIPWAVIVLPHSDGSSDFRLILHIFKFSYSSQSQKLCISKTWKLCLDIHIYMADNCKQVVVWHCCRVQLWYLWNKFLCPEIFSLKTLHLYRKLKWKRLLQMAVLSIYSISSYNVALNFLPLLFKGIQKNLCLQSWLPTVVLTQNISIFNTPNLSALYH